MTSIADVRTSLRQAVESTGLRCSAYVLDTITPPCAQVVRREYDPRFVHEGTKTTYRFSVLVFCARAAETVSAKLLDECGEPTGDRSLVAAIQDGDNWDVAVDVARVTSVGPETVIEIANVPYLTVEIEVEVVF